MSNVKQHGNYCSDFIGLNAWHRPISIYESDEDETIIECMPIMLLMRAPKPSGQLTRRAGEIIELGATRNNSTKTTRRL